MAKIKPIRLEVYQCPKCDVRIEGSYNDAQRHVSIPFDSPLPIGLVFEDGGDNALCYVVGNKGKIKSNHGFRQKVLLYGVGSPFTNSSCYYPSGHSFINSLDVKDSIKSGNFRLLSKWKFGRFCNKLVANIDLDSLIRVTPELEKLVD